MSNIEKLIKADIASQRGSMIFELLGKFGDRLPKDIQEEMRREARYEERVRLKMLKRVQESLK